MVELPSFIAYALHQTKLFGYLHSSCPPSTSEGVFHYSIIYAPSNTYQKPSSLFTFPGLLPSSSGPMVKPPSFIAYALHQTKLHPSVTFVALVLLQRLKACFAILSSILLLTHIRSHHHPPVCLPRAAASSSGSTVKLSSFIT